MSNCKNCYHEKKDKPDPNAPECQICIRNPEYPSKRMPKEIILEGVLLEVPQDMYIAKDRKLFEEKVHLSKEITKDKTRIQDNTYYPNWNPWVVAVDWTGTGNQSYGQNKNT